MALFEFEDLAALLQQPDLDLAAAGVVRDVATGVVEGELGRPVDDPVPAVVRAVALGVAARIYSNPRGVSSEGIDDYSVTYGGFTLVGGGGGLLTGDERRLLRRLRPTLGTVVPS